MWLRTSGQLLASISENRPYNYYLDRHITNGNLTKHILTANLLWLYDQYLRNNNSDIANPMAKYKETYVWCKKNISELGEQRPYGKIA